MMEIFSLENDECGDLFITQKSNDNDSISHLSGIADDSVNIASPHGFNANRGSGNFSAGQYSDISDDDAFEIPSSQAPREESMRVNYYNLLIHNIKIVFVKMNAMVKIFINKYLCYFRNEMVGDGDQKVPSTDAAKGITCIIGCV